MRSVDVLKCWPFRTTSSSDVTREDLKSCLPPMTVPKFRWWSDELNAVRSADHDDLGKSENQPLDDEISVSESESVKSEKSVGAEEEKLEMVCPVCRVFNAATLTAVNAHIDGCLAQTMKEERRHMRMMSLKSKSKAPKKRSIAEIFELEVEQPQIQTVLNFWPFKKNPDEVSITVTKFRWLSRQLEELRSNQSEGESSRNRENESAKSGEVSGREEEKLEMVCPVCRSFNAATVTAVNAHIDGCLAQAMREERRHMRMNLKPKPKAPKKRSIAEILTVAPQIEVKSSELVDIDEEEEGNGEEAKSDGGWDSSGACASEDSSKRKLQTPVNSARKLKGIIDDERVALDDIHKKKASLKYVSVEKKQKVVSPIGGILKNHSTHISGGCNIKDDTEERPCVVQELKSTRHVMFSNKDDVFGPKKRNSFDEIIYSLSSDGRATSVVKEQCSGSDEEAASLEVNKIDSKIAFNLDRKKEDCPIVESKQFSYIPELVTAQNFVRPCINQEKAKHLIQKSESSTEVPLGDNNNNNNSSYLFDRGNTTALHCSALQAGNISSINTQVGDSGAYSSTGKFIDHLGNSTCQVAAMNSDSANTRTFLQPSSLCSTSGNQANEGSLFASQTYGDNDISGQTLGYRPLSHAFSGWGKRAVRNNCMNKNFFGLPLNSQGELINFSSSGKGGMNQFETSSMSRSSSSALPVNNTAYLNGCANQLPHYPARLGVTELQGSERADTLRPNTNRSFNHYLRPIDSELNLMKYPFVEQKHHDRVPNHSGNGMISRKEGLDLSSTQPTMRLMGKDVPIGRSIKEVQVQQLEEEHVWADDQQFTTRHYYENATLENSLSKICSQSNQALQSTLLINGTPHSEFPQPFLDFQTHPDVPQQKASRPGFSEISSCYSRPITHPHPDGLPEQFIYGAKPLGLSSHLQVHSTTCNYTHRTCLSNGELNDRKKQPLDTNSPAFEYPFVHDHAKPSLFQSPYRNFPPWMLSSTHEKLSSTSCFPHNEYWGGNFTSPVNHSSQVVNPHNPLTSHCHMKIPLGSGSRNITRKEDNQWENTTTRKRPAAYNLDDESTKLMKLRNIIEVTGFAQESSRAVEFDSRGDSTRSKCCCSNEGQNINSKSYDLDGMDILHERRFCQAAETGGNLI
ncbi:uncharacterized protein G2W53_015871 [Senna tora]|uniref:UBZ4-type domain-containing protein n=1 Tax=Senna tora TaxID=362788 RepID=A0A834WWC8_9FABA|nr:uncharacterized protein G2W53_015871 [Senna tora]